MSSYALYKNQIAAIVLKCGIDVTAAQNPKIAVEKPDGSTTEWNATVNDATSLVYTTTGSDLDQVGDYKLQTLPDLPSGYARGRAVGLTVKDDFKP